MRKSGPILLFGAALTLAACASDTTRSASAAPVAASHEPVMVATRRTNESQYRHTIADLFGDDIKVNGRFEPEKREQGLFAVGASQLSVSAGGFEQYYAMGKTISDQVLDEKHRDRLGVCKPADPTTPDDACAGQFIRAYGERLFRRPMTEAEVAARVAAANRGASAKQDYYAGLKLALTSLLTAPEFVFRVEMAEPDPAHRGRLRLDGYTKAARLSYLMWDTAPDAELLAAAESGEIHTPAGLKTQIERLAASPRMQDGARAFFQDMLELDLFESVTKDAMTYPKFSAAVADSAKEQTLRTVVDFLVAKNGDYRDIFTTRETFMNRPLAAIYRVSLVGKSEWVPYTFPEGAGRDGVLTQVAFLTMFSHPGRSSPTKRGVALNEIFLCQETPLPPANVDFSIVNDTNNPLLKTVRQRLLAHATDETCAGCHNLSDPIGLSLEGFDGIGQARSEENGTPLDLSAELEGKKFVGAKGLGEVLKLEPRVPACLVQKVYAYGVGRPVGDDDQAFLEKEVKAFAADGYRLPALVKRIASSPEFFRPVLPENKDMKSAPAKVAALSPAPRSAGETR